MDVILLRYEIAPGQTERLREGLSDTSNRSAEIADILEREGMLTESLFLEETDGTDESDYLLWYMEAEDVEAVWRTYEEATDELVTEHDELLSEVLVGGFHDAVGDFECLIHATQPDRPAVLQ